MEIARRTTIKLRSWSGQTNFVVVKMDDFDVVLGMKFLLEHKVIPMPLTKCLVITKSSPTIVQESIKQLNGMRMILAL